MMQTLTNSSRNMFFVGASIGVLLVIQCQASGSGYYDEIQSSQLVRENNIKNPARGVMSNVSSRRRLPGRNSARRPTSRPQPVRLPPITVTRTIPMSARVWHSQNPQAKWKYYSHNRDYFQRFKGGCIRCLCKTVSTGIMGKCARCRGTGKSITNQCTACAGESKPCNLCLPFDSSKGFIARDGYFHMEQFGFPNAGVKKLVKDPDQFVMKAPRGETVIVVFGSGYHIVNKFKIGAEQDMNSEKGQRVKDSGRIPRGVAIDFDLEDKKARFEDLKKIRDCGVIKPASVQDVIDDIRAANFVEVRKKGIYSDWYRQERLNNRKNNIIKWLKNLTDEPTQCKIVFMRNVIQHKALNKELKETDIVKASWVSGLLGVLNKERKKKGEAEIKYVIDFGSGKTVLVRPNGTQVKGLNYEYNEAYDGMQHKTDKEDKLSLKEFIEKVVGAAGVPTNQIIARFTGDFRKTSGKHSKLMKAFKAKLKKIKQKGDEHVGIDCETLSIQDEGKFGGLSAFRIAKPFFTRVENVLAEEIGSGSTQGCILKRVQLSESNATYLHSQEKSKMSRSSSRRTSSSRAYSPQRKMTTDGNVDIATKITNALNMAMSSPKAKGRRQPIRKKVSTITKQHKPQREPTNGQKVPNGRRRLSSMEQLLEECCRHGYKPRENRR